VELTASVVVPTYNRCERLRRVLGALAAQTAPRDSFEVIVVSDGSTDGTDEYLHGGEMPLDVVAVAQPNSGPGPARNAGVERARGRLVVFIDDDVVAAPDLVEQHVRSHEQDGGRLIVMGPMLTPEDFTPTAWIQWEQDKLEQQYEAMKRGDWKATFRQFYTGNASLPRALMHEVGGFDDRFRRAEDVEMSYRLHEAGCRFEFNPHAVGWHYAERSFESWLGNARAYGVNDVIFARDHDRPELLRIVRDEFPHRNALIRGLVRLSVGRRRAAPALQAVLNTQARAAARLRLARPAGALLSAAYNLAYYRGIADELGGSEAFRSAILRPPAAAAVPSASRP
jgi:GT2 family glycosyltransferase